MISARLSALLLVTLFATTADAQTENVKPHGRKILALIGAKMEDGGSPERLASYKSIFKRLDANSDDWLNQKEFVDDGKYLTRRARQGIFLASDSDRNGYVSEGEYVVNRVITDEAKEIFKKIDRDGNGELTSLEFVANGSIADEKLAADVFQSLDADGDGKLLIPEYLRVWGRWARESPVTARLIVKQETYILPREWEDAKFRKQIVDEEDGDKLPDPPKVRLVLELRNTSEKPVMIWPRGHVDEPQITISGPGIVEPENLRSFSGNSSVTTPQPVIQPGKRHRITIKSLNPGGFSSDNVYWTKAGEYTITATYPVWKNLPPHPPQLFDQPGPQGPPMKFLVKTPPCKIKVVAER